MNKLLNLLFLGFIFLCFACQPDDDMIGGGGGGGDEFVVPIITPNGDEPYLENDSEYIFDQEKLHTFELKLPPSALSQIDANPTAEEYVEAMLVFEGDTLSPVGIRYKGSIGAFVNCVSGADWANPSGFKTCTKLSMKVKINWNSSDAKFFGLKKLQFHSMNNDPSQMRERLGYWLFREMGVPAPRSVHARLVINDVYVGLFALVEQIDGRFTRYNYDDGKGNLYKEVWPINHNGAPFPDATYRSALKTNEDENPSFHIIRGFGEEVRDASDEDLPQVIANRMDINEIISYAVVDRTIRNDDGAFHWYCDNGICAPHNYYWYEEPASERLHLIPWDLDHAFENIISNANPVTPVADAWGETRNDCQPFSINFFGPKQRSAACDKLTLGWTAFETEYEQFLQNFKDGPFHETQVDALLDTWEAQVRAATEEAVETHGDAISIGEWEGALSKLREQLEYAREH